MDSNIEKLYPKLKDVKPYGKDEIRPDEVKSWTEFDRALATFIVECLVTNNKDNTNGKNESTKNYRRYV